MEKIYAARYLLPVSAIPLEDGALLVRDGRIAAVGRRKDILSSAPRAEIVDFGDSVLLPPLVNAHTHLELTRFPEWASELGVSGAHRSFVDWILEVIRVKRSIDPHRYASSVQEGIRRSLFAGTGAVGDILSFFPARRAYAGSPLRGRLFFETLGRDPGRNAEILKKIEEAMEEGRAGRMEPGIAPHSTYTLSAEYLEAVFDFARRRKIPATLHLGESAEETLFLREGRGALVEILYPHVGWGEDVPPPAGCSPVAYLEERGGLNSHTLLVHGVQVGEGDAERLARAGCTVVLCPRSNARLGVGMPPLEMYRRIGVSLALGTDSLASCDSLSLWDEIAFARRLPGANPRFLLETATRGGARALGLARETGALESGFAADFQVLKPLQPPSMRELEEWLCAPGRTAEVSALFLDGRNVLEDPVIPGAFGEEDVL